MKKAGIFAAVIAVVLLFAQLYNYRLLGYTQEAMYVIDETKAAQILKNGGDGEEPADLELKRYEASAPVYSRGDRYFIGSEYEELNVSYPVYVNEGNYLYSMSDEMDLITSDFTTLNTYDGLYVVDGHSYNRDREQADPDEFIFIKSPGGLFLNVQGMQIRSFAQEQSIPSNSLLNLTEEGVSWYAFDGGMYRYGQYLDVVQAEVTVGSVTMPYKELVSRLLGLKEAEHEEKNGEETETLDELHPMMPLETYSGEEAGSGDDNEAGTSKPGKSSAEAKTPETEKIPAESEAESGQTGSAGAGTGAGVTQSEEVLPLHPPVPDGNESWRFPNLSGEDGSDGNGGAGEDGSEDDSEGEDQETPDKPEKPDGGQGGEGEQGEDGGTGEFPFEKPLVSVEDFDFSVYSATAQLSIQDPSFSIVKGVRLVFYKEGETRASYRKMFSAPGEITITPLEPDTAYEVEGYFDYYHPQYGKLREVFKERTLCGKTLPVSALTPMKVFQEADESAIEPYAVQIRDFQLLDGTGGTASDSDAERDLSAVPYIDAVQLDFEKKGVPDWNTPSASLGTTQLAQLKRGASIVWKTADMLDSDSRYAYRITFYDRFGNKLPVAEKSSAEGEARTCKQRPKAVLQADHKSTIDKMRLHVKIENADKAEYSRTPYLYITYADMPDTAVPFTLEGKTETFTRYELKHKDEAELVFTSLLPNTVYTVWVKGSFDMEDEKLHEKEVMGQLPVTTGSLTGLGTVNFQLDAEGVTSSSATVTSRIRSEVPKPLYPFISSLDFSLNAASLEDAVFSMAFERSELERETIKPGETYVLHSPSNAAQQPSYDPKVTVALPGDSKEKSVWDALLTNGVLKTEFGKGGLHSAADFQAHMRAKAVRGSDGTSVEEDVTGRYYQTSFKTLKQPAGIRHEMSYINGTSATFYKLRVDDPDGAVLGGKLILRLRNAANSALLEVRTMTVEELNSMDSITFQNLEQDTSYKVEVVAAEYNEGYSNSSKMLQKLLGEMTFRAKNQLYGTMKLDSMENTYDTQSAEDGMGVGSINLFDINLAALNYAINANGIFPSTNNLLSDYIRVEEGGLYLLGGGTANWIAEYDEGKDLIKTSNVAHVTGGHYYRAKEGVSYIRVYTGIGNSAAAFVSEVQFAEPDSEANLIRKTRVTEGTVMNGDQEQKQEDAASTGYIEVTPGEVLIRMDACSSEKANNWKYQRISFYDKDKKHISSTDTDKWFGVVSVPANAHYLRTNMHADCQDKIFLGRRALELYGKNILDKAETPELTWVPGAQLDPRNRHVKQTYNYYQYSQYVPVKASAVYYQTQVSSLLIYNAEKEFMGYISGTNYIKMPEKAAYIRVNVNFQENYNVTPVLRQITPMLNLDSVNIGIRVTLSDPEQNLGEEPGFTLEIEKTDASGETEAWTEAYQADPDSRKFDQVIYLENAEPDCQYKIRQTVMLGGNRVVLAEISLGTASTAKVIKSEAGLRAVQYNPTGDYIVVEDVELTTADNPIGNFYGTMDFQGHLLTMKGRRTLFTNIMEQGQVRNLVADVQVTKEVSKLNYHGLLADTNRGLMENIILKTSVNNGYDNYAWGGITYTNYGVLDNFAIQMTGDVYTRYYSGLAAYVNYGQVSNGYLVSDGNSRITLDEKLTSDGNRNLKAGLVGNHAGGVMKNVYAAAEIEDPSIVSNYGYQGLLAGEAAAEFKNGFSVGMTMQGGVPSLKTGPAVGYSASPDNVKNVSYVETKAFVESHYANSYNNRVSTLSLWDQEWMDGAINEEERFVTDMVSDGLYPQLKMPSCMDGKQPVVQLPSRQSASVKLLSNQVMEQTEDYAVVRFYFENRNRMEIKALELAVMNLESGVRTYLAPAAKTEILAQGEDEEGLYYADVKITEPLHFRSRYYVNKFTAGVAGNDNTNFDVEENSQEKMEVGAEFFQDIYTVADWRDKVCSSQADVYGNYRLKADVLDFGNLKPADFKTQYRLNRAFYGKIDGQWKDEEGNLHTTVMKNINMDMAYFIHDLYGTIRNLKVENLNINASETNKDTYVSFIRRVIGGTVDHVEILSSEVHGCYRVGILTSDAGSGAVIQNSYVKDSELVTFEAASNWKIFAGGLIGYGSRASVNNCYVQGLEIDNMKALDNSGVGGLIGYTDTITLKNCYSEGTIHTGYRNVGGLIGYQGSGASVVDNCYSKMNIDAYGSFVGGLIGSFTNSAAYDSFRGNLSLGNLFVHSTGAEGIHRLAGYPADRKYGENFGYESQMFNNRVDKADADDAEAVLTAEDLKRRETYVKRLGWDDETYALSWQNNGADQGVANGYLPKLKDTNGQILPGQDPIPFETGNMSLKLDGFSINNQAGDECQEWFGHKNITQAYKMVFSLSYDRNKYRVMEKDGVPEIYMDGMRLNARVTAADGNVKNGYRAEWLAGQNLQRWEFPFVQSELGGNVYCLNVVMQSVEDPNIQVILSAAVEPKGGTAIRIGTAQEWNDAMKLYKDTYGNFELTANIDLSEIPKEQLVTGIKINSLTSSGGNFAISGIDHEVKGIRDSFIASCLSGISNVTFKDCSWTVPEADRKKTFENIGLIGTNQGTVRNVTFENITVESGLGSYTGCIGYNMGTVEDVTVKNVKVSGDLRVGGLLGGTMQEVKRITAEGTLKKEGDGWTSGYLVSGRERVGGILGEGNLTDTIKVNGIKVLGTNGNQNSSKQISYIGGAVGNGNFTAAGQSIGENKQKGSFITDSVVDIEDTVPEKGAKILYIGGAAGNGSISYVTVENVEVICPEAANAGGLLGSGGVSYSVVRTAERNENKNYQIQKTEVEAFENAGGICGSGWISSSVAENLTVTARKANAGGIAGVSTGGTGSCLADRIMVRAPKGAGGISGEARSGITNNLVARSDIQTTGAYAGGAAGMQTTTVSEYHGNGVIHTVVQAGVDQDDGTSFAGGQVGSLAVPANVYGNYTRETTVTAEGDNVGGLFGYTAGGWIRQNFSDSSTTVTGRRNVGGITGLMQGRQTSVAGNYADAKFYESYNQNTVKGQDQVGGFVGSCIAGPGNYWVPNSENFYGLVMMGTVETDGTPAAKATGSNAGKATGNADLFLNTADGLGWSGKSLRLFTEASLNGKRAADLYPDLEYLASYKTASLGNDSVSDEEADVEKLTSGMLMVTSKDLMDTRIYNKAFEVGGMNWSGSWNYMGLGRMDTEFEGVSVYKPGTGVKLRMPDGAMQDISVETPLFDATDLRDQDGNVPVMVMPDSGVSCNWYRSYRPNASQNVTAKTGVTEFPLAGRGYYFGVVKMQDGSSKYTPVIKMDTEAYMPYANVGSIWSRGAQEGLPKGFGTELDASGSLWGWRESSGNNTTAGYTYLGFDGTDNTFYGGNIIPESKSGPAVMNLDEQGIGDAAVYPSGADKVNVELAADRTGFTRLIVTSNGEILCDTVPEHRVYTLHYDYRSPITVTLMAGGQAESVTVDPSDLRRTVMVWDEDYYYTCDGKLMDQNGVVLEEEIIHLYGGRALTIDGTVYDLETGENQKISREPWKAGQNAVPFWEDEELRTFGIFTEIFGAEEPLIREQQLVKKGGEIYALTGGQALKGMVLDSYNGEVYASFIDKNGRLKDSADKLHTPEGFNRNGIAHMSSSLDGEVPFVLVRYASGAAKGFNYVTGEELPVENAFSDISFLDFAAGFADQFFPAGTGNLEFADLKQLENQLTLAPITDGQLSEALERMEQIEEAEAAAETSDDGSGNGEGSADADGSESQKTDENPGESADMADENSKKEAADHKEPDGTEKPSDGDQSEKTASDDGMKEKSDPEDSMTDTAEESLPEESMAKEAEMENQNAAEREEQPAGVSEKTDDAEGGGADGEAKGGGQGGASEPAETAGAEEAEASTERKPDHASDKSADKKPESRNPSAGKKITYAYAFNTEDGSSRLYNAEDLLFGQDETLMDEEEKLELMKAAGIVTEDMITAPASSEERSKAGLVIFALTAAAAVSLAGVLIYRKRRYEK